MPAFAGHTTRLEDIVRHIAARGDYGAGEVDGLVRDRMGRSVNPWKKSGLAQRHRVLVGCAAASMRYHDEIRVFSRLMAKSVVGNNQ